MTWKALVTSLGMLLLTPGAARGAGGPVPPVQGGAGIAVPGKSVWFIASAAGRDTVIKRVPITPGHPQPTLRVSGRYGIPGAAYDGSLTGISHNGRTLVLEQIQAYPVKTTRLLVLDTQRMRIQSRIVLPGWSGVDAISPDARWLYLIHYASNNFLHYQVLAYDLVHGRLLTKPIVDPDDREGPMTGFPLVRLMSPGGQWAYTLYSRPSGVPFIHALDTSGRRAVCIDLPSLSGLGFNTAKFTLGPGARTLIVKTQGVVAATIDTRTFAVSTGGPFSSGLPAGHISHAERTGAVATGGGGGSSLPWELVLLPIAALAAAAVVLRRRAKPRAA